MDLALNNLQRLICHKTKQTKPNRVNLGVMLMKGYFAFPKASVLLETHHKIVYC